MGGYPNVSAYPVLFCLDRIGLDSTSLLSLYPVLFFVRICFRCQICLCNWFLNSFIVSGNV